MSEEVDWKKELRKIVQDEGKKAAKEAFTELSKDPDFKFTVTLEEKEQHTHEGEQGEKT